MKIKNTLILVVALAALLVVRTAFTQPWGYLVAFMWPTATPVPPKVEALGPTITKLEAIGQLAVLKVSIADVLKAESGNYKGAWLIKGDALIALDLRHAEILDKDEKAKTATVLLPELKVLQPRVDHSKTETWSVEKTSWIPWPWQNDDSELRDEAMRQAQSLVEHAVRLPDNLDQARDNSEIIIKNMFRMVDWEIKVTWNKAKGDEGQGKKLTENQTSN